MTSQERFLAKAGAAANAVLLTGAVASALTFLFYVYRYGWRAERRFAGWQEVLVYYVVPAVLAGLLFAALRLKREHKINLAIVCVTLVLSLYAGELVLRLVEPNWRQAGLPVMLRLEKSSNKREMADRLAKQFGVEIDIRDRLQVITELRAKGIDAVPGVLPRYQLMFQKGDGKRGQPTGDATTPQILALGGISNRMTVLCNESGRHLTYESDEHGFRNPRGAWQSGSVDIVALGDSFTQGFCVPSGKYFVDIVRQRYPATLNLGMAADGPLFMLSTLREYVPPLRPKLVLWFYFEGNDLLDLQDERRSAVLMSYLQDGFSQRLQRRQAEVDRALLDFVEKERAWELENRRAALRNRRGVVGQLGDVLKLQVLRTRIGLMGGTTDEQAATVAKAKDLTVFRQILSNAKATVASWGGTLYFVYLPNWSRFVKQESWDHFVEGQHENVIGVARQLEIPVVDVLPAFRAQPDPMALFPFRAPGHYTEDGHRLVAEEVLKAIATKVSQTNGAAPPTRPGG